MIYLLSKVNRFQYRDLSRDTNIAAVTVSVHLGPPTLPPWNLEGHGKQCKHEAEDTALVSKKVTFSSEL